MKKTSLLSADFFKRLFFHRIQFESIVDNITFNSKIAEISDFSLFEQNLTLDIRIRIHNPTSKQPDKNLLQ